MTILTCTNEELWALCVWREARGESDEAKLGVAYVIQTRSKDPKKRWPETIRGVILEPLQFSSFNKNDPNYLKFPSAEDPVWLKCKDTVTAVNITPDPTNGANSYHSLPIGKPWPRWARPEMMTEVIDHIRFYKL